MFKLKRNIARKELRKVKVAGESKFNPKSFWTYVNSRKTNFIDMFKLRKTNGSLTANNLATCLNIFFANVFTETSNIKISSDFQFQSNTTTLNDINFQEIILKLKNRF